MEFSTNSWRVSFFTTSEEAPSDKELERLPTIDLTSSKELDPSSLNNDLAFKDDWLNKIIIVSDEFKDELHGSPFDDRGDYTLRESDPPRDESSRKQLSRQRSNYTTLEQIKTDVVECFHIASNLNEVITQDEDNFLELALDQDSKAPSLVRKESHVTRRFGNPTV